LPFRLGRGGWGGGWGGMACGFFACSFAGLLGSLGTGAGWGLPGEEVGEGGGLGGGFGFDEVVKEVGEVVAAAEFITGASPVSHAHEKSPSRPKPKRAFSSLFSTFFASRGDRT
jgi:hypothetical protein